MQTRFYIRRTNGTRVSYSPLAGITQDQKHEWNIRGSETHYEFPVAEEDPTQFYYTFTIPWPHAGKSIFSFPHVAEYLYCLYCSLCTRVSKLVT
jgi:hypothetical protein